MGSDRFLVVGGDGLIGAALAARLRGSGCRALVTTRRPVPAGAERLFLDLSTDIGDWRAPDDVGVAYLCAACTGMRACEDAPEATRRINVEGTVAVAEAVRRRGAFLVFLSSNSVFDGTIPFPLADAPPGPATEYGRQKAEAERRIRALGEDVAVVRLTKVLAPTVSPFRDWLRALRAGEPICPLSDLSMAPIGLGLAVEVLLRVGASKARGIHQASGASEVSYAEAAHALAARLGAPAALVRPMRASEAAKAPLVRARHSTLDMTSVTDAFHIAPPDLDQALASLLG